MATVPRHQAARSRAPGSRRKAAAERPADDDGQATEEQQGRARSTTGDLLNLVEQLSNFDRIGVTRLARHLGVPAPTPYRMLRAADSREVRAIVGPGPYPRRTEHSITTYDELAAELTEIQRLGYAVDRQELNLGVWCVAAPILGVRQTQPAAVSVSAYRPHLD